MQIGRKKWRFIWSGALSIDGHDPRRCDKHWRRP
jgi:hypothetical protein